MNIDSNASETTELDYWIHDPIFNQIKEIAIDVRVISLKTSIWKKA
jgi:hypothetical protein